MAVAPRLPVERSVTTATQRAALRWQVRTGRYKVDAARVAAAMLSRIT